jgi:serine/threonine protein kinase
MNDVYAETDPLMRILDLRERLGGRPFTLETNTGGVTRQYSFTDDEPILGGFAAVFRVVEDGRSFALKVAHREGSSVERPQQEASSFELQRVLSDLGGPVPTTYYIGRVDGVPAVLMSWESGETLQSKLDGLGVRTRSTALNTRQLRLWIEAVVRAMSELDRRVAELHGDGRAGSFVHGDLKPANILLRKGRSRRERVLATILDFSEARVGPVRGTVGITERFASPELRRRQSDSSTEVTWRSDQFSIGQMLQDGIDRIEQSGSIRFFQRRFGAVARLQAIATRMTTPSPEDRFGSWDEVLDALYARTRRRVTRWVIASCILVSAVLLLQRCVSQEIEGRIVLRAIGSADSIERFANDMEIVCTHSPYQPNPDEALLSPDSGEAVIPLAFEVDQVPKRGEKLSFTIEVRPRRVGWKQWVIGLFDGWRGKSVKLVDEYRTCDGSRSLRSEIEAILADRVLEMDGLKIEASLR